MGNNTEGEDKDKGEDSKIHRGDWSNKYIKNWNRSDIYRWLESIGFEKKLRKYPKFSSLHISGEDLGKISINVEDFESFIPNLFDLFFFFCNLHIVQYCLERNHKYPKGFYVVCLKLFRKRVLNQKVLRRNNLSEWKISTFSLMCYWLSEREYIKVRFLDPRETSGDHLEIKLVINENTSSGTMKKVISPILNTVLPKSSPLESGLFHLSLMVGPWSLHWTDTAVVLPRSHTSGDALLSIDVGIIPTRTQEDRERIKNILSTSIVEWNTEYQYSNHPKKGKKVGNSHTFSMYVLEKLDITVELEDGVLKKFLSEKSFWGECSLTFKPSNTFVEDFKLKENEDFVRRFYSRGKRKKGKFVIEFSTHRDLDEFVYYCSDTNEKLMRKYDEEFTLLKSFDRAFWLRHGKDPHNEDYKPHPFTEERIFGCPYSDLRDTAFWSGFFLEHRNTSNKSSEEELEGENEKEENEDNMGEVDSTEEETEKKPFARSVEEKLEEEEDDDDQQQQPITEKQNEESTTRTQEISSKDDDIKDNNISPEKTILHEEEKKKIKEKLRKQIIEEEREMRKKRENELRDLKREMEELKKEKQQHQKFFPSEEEKQRLLEEYMKEKKEKQLRERAIKEKGKLKAYLVGQDGDGLLYAFSDGLKMSGKLKKMGYECTEELYRGGKNEEKPLTLGRIQKSFRRFVRTLEKDDKVVFYFSGHGHQRGGKNYLMCAKEDEDDEVVDRLVELDFFITELREKDTKNVFFLDCCQDDPNNRVWRGGGGGGGSMNPIKSIEVKGGKFVFGFACLPGLRTEEKGGGVFTKSLVKAMSKEEEILTILRKANIEMYEEEEAQGCVFFTGAVEDLYL